MTAPALQDPRKDMELHCRFDMGGEDLYAVKWYKDDHEFFRYIPGSVTKSILQFPVAGVHVEERRTRCVKNGCDLLLTQLSRPQSSGAYRCEVSSEAPAFRLASQTHNVTVAALPEEKPRIEGLADAYVLGDQLTASCTSGLGDPKPVLTWYINKQQVPSKALRELTSASYIEDQGERIKLKSSTSQLTLRLDKKLVQNQVPATLEVSCVSSMDGINPMVAPPLTTTRTIRVHDHNQLVNISKFTSPFARGATIAPQVSAVVLLAMSVRWLWWLCC